MWSCTEPTYFLGIHFLLCHTDPVCMSPHRVTCWALCSGAPQLLQPKGTFAFLASSCRASPSKMVLAGNSAQVETKLRAAWKINRMTLDASWYTAHLSTEDCLHDLLTWPDWEPFHGWALSNCFEIRGLAQGLAYARRRSLLLLLLSLFLKIDYTANLFNWFSY